MLLAYMASVCGEIAQRLSIMLLEKMAKRKTRAKLQLYQVVAHLKRIGIYILGPLPITDRRNIYVMMVADYFITWVEANPLKNQTSESVVD